MKPYAGMVALVAGLFGLLVMHPAYAEYTTREQVVRDLKDLERVGYDPSVSRVYYPCDISAAEAIVQQNRETGVWQGTDAYQKALIKCH